MKREKINHDSMKHAYDGLLKTFVAKNRDYGNSFEQSLDAHGLVASIVRMEDKFNRLKSLVGRENEAEVASESLSDTLLDLANYATMTAVYLEAKNNFNKIELFKNSDRCSLYPNVIKISENIKQFNAEKFAGFSSILEDGRVDQLFELHKEKTNTTYYFFPTLRVNYYGFKFFTIVHDIAKDDAYFVTTGSQQNFVEMLNHPLGIDAFDGNFVKYRIRQYGDRGVFFIDSLKHYTNNRWLEFIKFGNVYNTNNPKNEFSLNTALYVNTNVNCPIHDDLLQVDVIYSENNFTYDVINNCMKTNDLYYVTNLYDNGLVKSVELVTPKKENSNDKK